MGIFSGRNRISMNFRSLIGILEIREFLGKIEKKVNLVFWLFFSFEIVRLI